MSYQTALLFTLSCLVAACADPRRDEQDSMGAAPTGVSTAGDTSSAGGASGTDTAGITGTESSSDGAIKFDLGEEIPDAGGKLGEPGCDKVDFLFVIDNSGSMGDEQSNLAASFPGFIDTISAELDQEQDFHILVTDVDAYVYEACIVGCECTDAAGMCDPAPECTFPCLQALPCILEGFACGTEPMECEDVLGAGVTFPQGSGASNQDCNFTSGARYMDSSEPDLNAAFTCAARVGTGSMAATELPMEAMVNAVSPNTEAFACNAGWIRDDAILVVTFITDESDDPADSSGTVEGWRQALIAAKGGDQSAIVVLGLFGDNDLPGSLCGADGAETAPRLRQFVDSWGDNGVFGSVCAASYANFFDEAVGIIDTTCDDFVPPQG